MLYTCTEPNIQLMLHVVLVVVLVVGLQQHQQC